MTLNLAPEKNPASKHFICDLLFDRGWFLLFIIRDYTCLLYFYWTISWESLAPFQEAFFHTVVLWVRKQSFFLKSSSFNSQEPFNYTPWSNGVALQKCAFRFSPVQRDTSPKQYWNPGIYPKVSRSRQTRLPLKAFSRTALLLLVPNSHFLHHSRPEAAGRCYLLKQQHDWWACLLHSAFHCLLPWLISLQNIICDSGPPVCYWYTSPAGNSCPAVSLF